MRTNFIKVSFFIMCSAALSLQGSQPAYDIDELKRGLTDLKNGLAANNATENDDFVDFLEASIDDISVLESSSDYAPVFSGIRSYIKGKKPRSDKDYSFIRWPLANSDEHIFGKLAYDSRLSFISDKLEQSNSGIKLSEDEYLWLYMAISQLAQKEYYKYYDLKLLKLLAQCANSEALNEAFSASNVASKYSGNNIFSRNILDTVDSLSIEEPQVVWAYFADDYKDYLIAHLAAFREFEDAQSSVPSLRGRFLKERDLGADPRLNLSKLVAGIEKIYGESIPGYSQAVSTLNEDEFVKMFFKRRGVIASESLKKNNRKLLSSFANLVAYYDYSTEGANSIDGRYDPRILFLHMFGL